MLLLVKDRKWRPNKGHISFYQQYYAVVVVERNKEKGERRLRRNLFVTNWTFYSKERHANMVQLYLKTRRRPKACTRDVLV